jgi:hypothetical protein
MEENAQLTAGTEGGGILRLEIDYPQDRFPPAAVDLLQKVSGCCFAVLCSFFVFFWFFLHHTLSFNHVSYDSLMRVALLCGAQLFVVDPFKRLGANGADEIKAHPFFAGIDWPKLANMEVTPPFKPDVCALRMGLDMDVMGCGVV